MNMSVNPASLPPNAAIDTATLMSEAIDVVKTYLQTATVAPSDLPELIKSVYEAILSPVASAALALEPSDDAGFISSSKDSEDETEEYAFANISRTPAVPVEESVHNDGIICLIDGTKKLMIKRHIRAISGMEWKDYIAHYNLPSDYPSVAPGYSAEKSRYAKKVGLGSKIDKTPRKDRKEAKETLETPATPMARVRRVRRVKMADIA